MARRRRRLPVDVRRAPLRRPRRLLGEGADVAINLSLSKLPWYGQVGAFVFLSIAGAGVFWNFYAKAAQESISQREAQLATIQGEIQRGQGTARRLPEFRRQVKDLEAQCLPRLDDEGSEADVLVR